MLWMLSSAWAAVPTASGLGDLKWGQPAPPEYDGCEPLVVSPTDLFGVVPNYVETHYLARVFGLVLARFEGLPQGDAIEAAVTKQLGAPYEPYRDDLYWNAAGGTVSVRLERDEGGSATLAVVQREWLGRWRAHRVGFEPEWWAVPLDEVRAAMGQGAPPAWPTLDAAFHEAMKKQWEVCFAKVAPPPNTVARTFEDAMGSLPAPKPVPAPSPRAGLHPIDAQERALLDAARIGACSTWQGIIFGACKRVKRELAAFDAERGL